MFLYLLRHGPAEDIVTVQSRYADDRPLSKDGIEKMHEAAKGMKALGLSFSKVVSSPLSRTRETAEIVLEHCKSSAKLELSELLLPGTSLNKIMPLINPTFEHTLLVGHAPDVGQITAKLLGSSSAYIEFKKGALGCLEVANGEGNLVFFMQPRILRNIK